MNIEIGVIVQVIIVVSGVVATYATVRAQLANNTKELSIMRKRVEKLEKETMALLSRKEAEEHYVTKIELALTIENINIKLKHIEHNQSEMLEILKRRGKENES